MKLLLALSLALLAWTYAGYPLLMILRARIRSRPVRTDASARPFLSVIIAARDEERVIGRKLASVRAQGWPADRLEVIVVDDGSTDATAAIAARDPDARVISQPPSGKAVALAAAVDAAKGEILVFTDARQELLPGTLAALAAPFADDMVGAVSGELELAPGGGGLGVYRKLDDAVRRAEAATGSSVGVTGALWAMRRALFVPMQRGLILDDLCQPLCVARTEARVVVAPDARVLDAASPDPAREMRRRVRTLAGNLQLVRAEPWLLSPTANPLFFRLLSHKLLRLAAPFALAAALASNVILVIEGGGGLLAGALLAAQIMAYGLAATPWPESPSAALRPVAQAARISRSFVVLHLAAARAVWVFLRGEEGALWRDARPIQPSARGATA